MYMRRSGKKEKYMKKTMIIISAALLLALSSVWAGIPAYAEVLYTENTEQTGSGEEHLHSDADGNVYVFTEWTDPSCLPENGGEWYLGTDVRLKTDWAPKADTKLCLNGHVISTDNGSCLWLEEVSLDIFDEEDSAVHYFRFREGGAWMLTDGTDPENVIGADEFSLGSVKDGDVIALSGGVITGRDMFIDLYSDIDTEPSVHLSMYGGNIAGIDAVYSSPVVITGDAVFTMYGGSISGNFYPYGDIIKNRTGSVMLLGGTAAGNIASGSVVNSGADTPPVISGSISVHDNIAEKGAVCAVDTDVIVGGSAVISDNVTSSGNAANIYLADGHMVIPDSPEQGMRAGISTEETPGTDRPVMFGMSPEEGDEAYFFSDAGHNVVYKPFEDGEGGLYLTPDSTVASVFGGSSPALAAVLALIVIAASAAAAAAVRKKGASGK